MVERIIPISIENPDPTNIAALIELPMKSTEYEGLFTGYEDEEPVSKKITFIWPLADIYIYIPKKDPYNPVNQLDNFKKNPIIITFRIPRILLLHPIVKEYGKERLFPIYFDGKKWVNFKVKLGEDWENDTVQVKLEEWIKDPPVGWGGDYPQ